MQVTRRELIKAQAVTAAATVIGISVPGAQALAQTGTQDGVRWDKGVCRFCGTGCGVLIGTKDNKIVATQGDPDAPVRAAAALAIARTRVPAAHSLPSLVQLLEDPVPEVRVHAAIALSGLGREAAQALPYLRAHAQDPDPGVASAANAAVETIEKAGQDSTAASFLNTLD